MLTAPTQDVLQALAILWTWMGFGLILFWITQDRFF